MPDQIEALIAKARNWYDSELSPESEALITRLADALSDAHTVIEEAKARLADYDENWTTRSIEDTRRILDKFPTGSEDRSSGARVANEQITPSEIVARFSSLSSGTVRSIIQTGQALIDERMADGVFE